MKDLQDVPVRGMPGQITSKGTVLVLDLGSSNVSVSNISCAFWLASACLSMLAILTTLSIVDREQSFRSNCG